VQAGCPVPLEFACCRHTAICRAKTPVEGQQRVRRQTPRKAFPTSDLPKKHRNLPVVQMRQHTRAFYGLRGPPAQTSWSLRGPKTRRNARGPHAGFPGASRPRARGVLRGQITTRRLAGRTTRRDGSLRIGRRHPVGPDLRFPDALEMPQSKSMR
jgi:hypothetical protein